MPKTPHFKGVKKPFYANKKPDPPLATRETASSKKLLAAAASAAASYAAASSGINVSIKKQAEKKLAAEHHQHEVCEREPTACRLACQDKEQEIESHKEMLRKRGIVYPTLWRT